MVWLPDEKVALVGNFFSALIGHIPNLVTMRGDRLRDPLAFVASVDRILALEPDVILPGHHGAVQGADLIRGELIRIRDATQWVHDQTVAGMNGGKTVWELMDEVSLPPELEASERDCLAIEAAPLSAFCFACRVPTSESFDTSVGGR